MSRLKKKFEKRCTWKNKAGPNIINKLKKITESFRRYTILYSNRAKYETKDCEVTYIVNIKERTCDC